jgi:hypothetical protein
MNTKYWNKKQTFFANKCEEQKDMNDDRTLRKYVHPKTNEPGEVYEYQRQDFDGMTEAVYIEESEYGNTLCFGLQGSDYVNVLKFKLFKATGGLTNDIVKVARVIQNIDFSKELTVSIWENFKKPYTDREGKQKVPVYLMFKQDDGSGGKWPKSVASSFEYDEENRCYVGIPPVEKKTSMGKEVYDSTARDEFLYAIIEEAIESNKGLFEARKESRPATPAEVAAEPVPAGDVEDDSEVPF